MLVNNPKSERDNPFRKIYDNEKFKRILNYRNNLPAFPFIVDIELTNHCNLQCVFCGQQAMTREKGFLSWNNFKKVVDECSIYNTPIRFIRWGEPFLHKDIIKFARYVKSKDLPLHITNNGLVITETDMKALVEIGVDSLVFSFQGATDEQYKVMRNNNRYQTLKENILKLIKIRGDSSRPFIHISTTVTNESEEEINNFVQYWAKIVDSVGVGKTNLSRLSSHQIKSLETIGKIEELKKQETINKVYRPCAEVYQKLGVDWDGKITCCCGDFDNYMSIGDVSDDNLYDIWNNCEELKTIRSLLDRVRHRTFTLCSTCYYTYEEFAD